LVELILSEHWRRKRKYRPDITEAVIEYALNHGKPGKDKRWIGVNNLVVSVPPSGRTLKVVYRVVGRGTFKIITAYWLD